MPHATRSLPSPRSHTSRGNARRWRSMEPLESRTLLSNTTLQGLGTSLITSVAYDSNGVLWATDFGDEGGRLVTIGADGSITPVYTGPGGTQYQGLVAGPNGRMAFVDVSQEGQFDVIYTFNALAADPASTVDEVPIFPNGSFGQGGYVTKLTITGDSAIWYLTVALPDDGGNAVPLGQKNLVGRVAPDLATVATITTDSSDPTVFAKAFALSAANFGAQGDGVYVGFQGLDFFSAGDGHNVIGRVTVDGSNLAISYALPSADTVDVTGPLTSIATDPRSDAVWFSIEPGTGSLNDPAASRILRGTWNASHDGFASISTYLVPGAAPMMGLDALAFDFGGDLWFVGSATNEAGHLDTKLADSNLNDAFSIAALPSLPDTTPTTLPFALTINPLREADPLAPAAIIGTFGGFTTVEAFADITPYSANEFAGEILLGDTFQEERDYNLIPIAMFTAPDGVYEAVINWGDGSPLQVVLADGSGGGNTWVVYASKRWASHTLVPFQGSVQIRLYQGADIGDPLTFSYNVSDTPLDLGDISVASLFRIAVLSVSFTDDLDAQTSWYSATIQWAPGVTTRGIIVRDPCNPGRFYILGLYRYASSGTYTINVTVATTEANPAVEGSLTATTTITV